MVIVICKNGIVNLESTLTIPEGICERIKANPDKVKTVLKDLHIEHFLAITEDGTITSKVGTQMPSMFDPVTAAANLRDKHEHFIDWASNLPIDDDKEAIAEEASGESIDHQDEDENNDDRLFGFFIIPMCI